MNIYIEQMQQINPEAITCDGFDDAIIGIIHNHWNMLKEPIFAYSMRKMVDIIVERDKMDYRKLAKKARLLQRRDELAKLSSYACIIFS